MSGIEKKPASLCILRLSAIGDVCNCLASVKALQSALPHTRLTWVIGKTEHALVGNTPGIEFITFDKRAGFRGYRSLRKSLADRRFDALLLMHASMRANIASLMIKANRRIGFDRNRARDFQWLFSSECIKPLAKAHVVDGFLQFVEAVTGHPQSPRWGIDIDSSSRESAANKLGLQQPYAAISPCSSDRARNFRNWPAERYAAIINYMATRYQLRTVLTGGNSALEQDYGSQIEALCEQAPVNMIGKTSLPELYAILDNAALLICPDSGPMHMAASADTAAIGLFATSNPARTGPYRRRELIVSHYHDAVSQYLGKSVDDIRWGERVRHPEAMLLIDENSVRERIDQLLLTSSG